MSRRAQAREVVGSEASSGKILSPRRALAPQRIPQLLVQKALVTTRDLLAGEVRITPLSQRHQNFRVSLDHAPGFFIKQGTQAGTTGTLAREARIYELLTRAPANPSVCRFLPRVHDYDARADVLILEEVACANDLLKYHEGSARFPVGIGRSLGQALGSLHAAALPEAPPECGRPMALNLQRPELGVLRRASAATLELMQLVRQQPCLFEGLEKLRLEWRSETFIHCDVKLANVLVERGARRRIQGVRLVDWEFAGLGDPAWDLGSVFAAYLALWVSSIPMPRTDEPALLMHEAGSPLLRIQPLLGAFWDSYCRTLESMDGPTPDLWRALRMTAARLLQTVYELCQFTMDLSGRMAVLVQLAINILDRPQDALVHLLALPTPSMKPSPR